jgi:uncharacterized membrane protein YccC
VLNLAANSTSTLNDVEPGLLGFLVVAALGLALYFLLRSMNKHLRKVASNAAEAGETDAEGARAEGHRAAATQRPLRGLAAHRAAMAAAAEADAKAARESSDSGSSDTRHD